MCRHQQWTVTSTAQIKMYERNKSPCTEKKKYIKITKKADIEEEEEGDEERKK